MKLNIGVQIDEKINYDKDSTFLLMKEAQSRGYKLFHYTSDKLFLRDNVPYAMMKPVSIANKSFVFADEVLQELDNMDIILMRQNPPFDMRYITTTYILEKCKKAKVLNNPAGVRNSPEKLSVHFTVPTLVSEDLDLIDAFHKEHKDVILKPLYAFGGQNVSCIKGDGTSVKIIANIIKDTYNCPIMIQKFIPGVLKGDKRVMILGDKIIGVFSRVPQHGDFRTNLCLGNRYDIASLTNEEQGKCNAISESLCKDGVVLAGIDLIDSHVIEVNVTSATGLLELNHLYGKNVEKDCWDYFESML